MGTRSKGRGAAAFGLLVLLGGLIAAVVLYATSIRRPDRAVDAFARAPIGCTTTLDFTQTGTFFVFEETEGDFELPEGECQPTASERPFGFDLSGPGGEVALSPDTSLSYDTGDFVGSSVARFEIDEVGQYEIEVYGEDADRAAVVGRDPDAGVAGLRWAALVVAAVGLLVGGLVLVMSGRAGKRVAAGPEPGGPPPAADRADEPAGAEASAGQPWSGEATGRGAVGWEPAATEPVGQEPVGQEPVGEDVWPPRPPTLDRLPADPPLPIEVRTAPPPPPTVPPPPPASPLSAPPQRPRERSGRPASPWAPPGRSDAAPEATAPPPPPVAPDDAESGEDR